MKRAQSFKQTPRSWLCQAAGVAPWKGVGESDSEAWGLIVPKTQPKAGGKGRRGHRRPEYGPMHLGHAGDDFMAQAQAVDRRGGL